MSRPSWMDGGAEQRAYCGWLKNVVKSARRQQSHAHRHSYSVSSSSLSDTQQSQLWLASRTGSVEVVVPETASSQVLNWETDTSLLSPGVDERDLSSFDWNAPQEYMDSLAAEVQQHPPLPLSPGLCNPESPASSHRNADCESDWLFLMRYFDCTMQRLFPFYCPVEHADERGYLLHLAHRSLMVRTALMSAASNDLERERTDAQARNVELNANLTAPTWLIYYHQASQMTLSELETLANDEIGTLSGFRSLSALTTGHSRHSLAVETLASIVHLIFLGVSSSRSAHNA